MDEALRQVARDAQVGHWAPHLGLTSDAERIRYLAERLESALEFEAHADDLQDQLTTAQEEIDMLESERDNLKDRLKRIRQMVAE